MTGVCRNCGSTSVLEVNQGVLAPFFAKRVHGIDVATFGTDLQRTFRAIHNTSQRRLLTAVQASFQRLNPARRALAHRSSMHVRLRVCADCTFVGPDRGYSDDDLMPLYTDYRSASYNTERSAYEPGYAQIQDVIGRNDVEVISRLANVDVLLADVLRPSEVRTVIDWGGADGSFVPHDLRNCEVLIVEVSDEPLADSRFSRVDSVPVGTRAQYVQICHLLEHVSSPSALLDQALRHADDGAIIYLEVPLDRSAQEILRFQRCDGSVLHTVHEHLNLFTIESLRRLGTSAGLDLVSVTESALDLGWTKSSVISGVFRFRRQET